MNYDNVYHTNGRERVKTPEMLFTFVPSVAIVDGLMGVPRVRWVADVFAGAHIGVLTRLY